MAGQHLSTGEIVTDTLLDTYGRVRKLRSEMYQAGRELRHALPRFRTHPGKVMLAGFMSAEPINPEELARAREVTIDTARKWTNAELLRIAYEELLPEHLAKVDRDISSLLRNKIIEAKPAAGISAAEAIGIKRGRQTVGSLHVPEEGVRGVFRGVNSGEGQLFLDHPEQGSNWQVQVAGGTPPNIHAMARLVIVPTMSPELPRLDAY